MPFCYIFGSINTFFRVKRLGTNTESVSKVRYLVCRKMMTKNIRQIFNITQNCINRRSSFIIRQLFHRNRIGAVHRKTCVMLFKFFYRLIIVILSLYLGFSFRTTGGLFVFVKTIIVHLDNLVKLWYS